MNEGIVPRPLASHVPVTSSEGPKRPQAQQSAALHITRLKRVTLFSVTPRLRGHIIVRNVLGYERFLLTGFWPAGRGCA